MHLSGERKIVSDFENLHYLLDLNSSGSNNESGSEKKVVKARLFKNSCKNASMEIENGTSKVRNSESFEGERNANGNQAVL